MLIMGKATCVWRQEVSLHLPFNFVMNFKLLWKIKFKKKYYININLCFLKIISGYTICGKIYIYTYTHELKFCFTLKPNCGYTILWSFKICSSWQYHMDTLSTNVYISTRTFEVSRKFFIVWIYTSLFNSSYIIWECLLFPGFY